MSVLSSPADSPEKPVAPPPLVRSENRGPDLESAIWKLRVHAYAASAV